MYRVDLGATLGLACVNVLRIGAAIWRGAAMKKPTEVGWVSELTIKK